MSDETLSELCAKVQGNPYFYNHTPPSVNQDRVMKFDDEDLQLVTYTPLRDEFENVRIPMIFNFSITDSLTTTTLISLAFEVFNCLI